MASISSLTQQVWVSVPVHHWIISHHELLWFRRSWSCIKSAMTDLFSSVVVARWEKITSLNCSCLCELGCLSNPGVVTLQFLPPKQVYDWINIAAVPQTHFSGLDLLQATGTNTPSPSSLALWHGVGNHARAFFWLWLMCSSPLLPSKDKHACSFIFKPLVDWRLLSSLKTALIFLSNHLHLCR